jgi:hypothetical protein
MKSASPVTNMSSTLLGPLLPPYVAMPVQVMRAGRGDIQCTGRVSIEGGDDVADRRRTLRPLCEHGDYSSSHSQISLHLYSSAVTDGPLSAPKC